MSSHYDALGVPRNASKADIRKAYKKKASKHHPDKGGKAEDMAAVNRANDVLMDDTKRLNYDQTGSDTPGRTMAHDVRDCLVEFFNQALEQNVVDIVKQVRFNLSTVITTTTTQLGNITIRVAYLKEKRSRVVSKGKVNLFADLIDGKIKAMEDGHLAGTQKLGVIVAALEALSDYSSVMPEAADYTEIIPSKRYVQYNLG